MGGHRGKCRWAASRYVAGRMRDEALQVAERGADWSLATHDGRLREAVLLALGKVPVEQLLGIRPGVLADLREREIPTRVYIPYGPSWFRYWLRRVAESRGA